MKRSRPQGLGTSSAKKEKPEAEAEDVQKDTQDNITEVPEAQVKVVEEPARTFFELPEDATALDQLKALFEFSQMNSDDTVKVTPILNGIINECVRLEGIKDAEEAPEEQAGDSDDIDSFASIKRDSDRIFVPEFYYYFGESLRLLASFEMNSIAHENESLDYVIGLLSKAESVLLDAYQIDDDKNSGIKKDIEESLSIVFTYFNVLTEEQEEHSDILKDFELNLSLVENSLTDALNYSYSLVENHSDSLPEGFKASLLKNLNSLDEMKFFSFLKESLRLKISKIDAPFRFLVSESSAYSESDDEAEAEISEEQKEKCAEFSIQLRELLKGVDSVDMEDEEKNVYRYEILMLLGSILEWTEAEEEAQKIYAQADALGFTN